jgi:hypothetical protein
VFCGCAKNILHFERSVLIKSKHSLKWDKRSCANIPEFTAESAHSPNCVPFPHWVVHAGGGGGAGGAGSNP